MVDLYEDTKSNKQNFSQNFVNECKTSTCVNGIQELSLSWWCGSSSKSPGVVERQYVSKASYHPSKTVASIAQVAKWLRKHSWYFLRYKYKLLNTFVFYSALLAFHRTPHHSPLGMNLRDYCVSIRYEEKLTVFWHVMGLNVSDAHPLKAFRAYQ